MPELSEKTMTLYVLGCLPADRQEGVDQLLERDETARSRFETFRRRAAADLAKAVRADLRDRWTPRP